MTEASKEVDYVDSDEQEQQYLFGEDEESEEAETTGKLLLLTKGFDNVETVLLALEQYRRFCLKELQVAEGVGTGNELEGVTRTKNYLTASKVKAGLTAISQVIRFTVDLFGVTDQPFFDGRSVATEEFHKQFFEEKALLETALSSGGKAVTMQLHRLICRKAECLESTVPLQVDIRSFYLTLAFAVMDVSSQKFLDLFMTGFEGTKKRVKEWKEVVILGFGQILFASLKKTVSNVFLFLYCVGT